MCFGQNDLHILDITYCFVSSQIKKIFKYSNFYLIYHLKEAAETETSLCTAVLLLKIRDESMMLG